MLFSRATSTLLRYKINVAADPSRFRTTTVLFPLLERIGLVCTLGVAVMVPVPVDGADNKDSQAPTVAVAKNVVPLNAVCCNPVETVILPPEVTVDEDDAILISLKEPFVVDC